MAYQVFISFKRGKFDGSGLTRDYELAADLHKTLRAQGIEVFFSEKDLSTSAFRDEIDEALDEAQILIAVGTSKANLDSQNVKYEWRSFYDDLLGGYKPNGEIYTYLEGMSQSELPRALRQRQSFTSEQKDILVAWVKNNLGIKDEEEQEEPPVSVEETSVEPETEEKPPFLMIEPELEENAVPYVAPEPEPEPPLFIIEPESDDYVEPKPEPIPKPKPQPKPIEKTIAKPISDKPKIAEEPPKAKDKRKFAIGAVAAVLVVAIVMGVVMNSGVFGQTNGLQSLDNIKSINQLSVGQHVTFGTYEQDGDESNGTEPIEWRILVITDGKALLISEYILDCKLYNSTVRAVTWSSCTLRLWLNNDFYDSVFNSNEQSKIALTSDSNDRVFLLDRRDLTYFSSQSDKIAYATDYAENNGLLVDKAKRGRWFLSSAEEYSYRNETNVYAVSEIGTQVIYSVDTDYIGVRPAMWVEIQ